MEKQLMKGLALLYCIAAVTACPLLAQQNPTSGALPPTTTEVMNFYEVMHVREQTQTMLEAEQKQVRIMIGDMFSKKLPDATAEQRKQFEQLMDTMVTDVFKNYPIDDILREMVPVYQKHLTESDLNAVVAFYSSPVGQKLRREMPAMTKEGLGVSYTHLRPRLEEMMKNAEALMQKILDGQENGKATSNK
jgi:uncharacterized protein